MDKSTAIFGGFNIPFSVMKRTSRYNISKDLEE